MSTMAKRCYPLTKPLVVNPNPIWHKQFKRNCLSSSKNKPQDVRIWMSPGPKPISVRMEDPLSKSL